MTLEEFQLEFIKRSNTIEWQNECYQELMIFHKVGKAGSVNTTSVFYRGLVETKKDDNLEKPSDSTGINYPICFKNPSGRGIWIISKHPLTVCENVSKYGVSVPPTCPKCEQDDEIFLCALV